MAPVDKQELTSMSITENQLQKFKEIFPEAFTEGNKVDWDKLRLTLGETIDVGKERFGMNWPGKADCFKNIQQPSIATLVPDRVESIDFDATENLFIEGDNLEVLKLLQKSYLGKIKMIYIDPPYNTGKEFIYPDNYSENLNTYLEYTGQIDGEGRKFSTNVDTDGRFHSKWLNMMYPRLFLAKNLLDERGFIFISIDDHEQANLKKLCDEIFGEENFIACNVWQRRTSPDARLAISTAHEYILMYAKNWDLSKSSIRSIPLTEEQKNDYKNPDNDPRGPWVSSDFTAQIGHATPQQFYTITAPNEKQHVPPPGTCWKNIESVYLQKLSEGRFWFGKDGNGFPRRKTYLSEKEGRNVWTWWSNKEVGHNQEATKELKELLNVANAFDNPKPTRLLKRIMSLVTDEDSIVLDFFAGSGTTAQAVLDLNKEDCGNRKFIGIQLPEPTEENTEAYKAGYKNIADISKERIRKVINKIAGERETLNTKNREELFVKEEPFQMDLGFKIFKLKSSNFKIWDADITKEPEAIQQALFEHIEHISPEAKQESILFELLLKSGFPLTTPIEQVNLSGKNVYSIADGELLICLEKELTNEVIKKMAERQPSRVICLDEGFQNNDQLKTNAVQIMKSKGVLNFRTV